MADSSDSQLATRNSQPSYWRSLEDYAQTPQFREWAEREFPAAAMKWEAQDADGGVGRRTFLQLMGASMALAGLVSLPGCRQPEHKIRTYNAKPEEVIPGKSLYYATTFVLAGEPIGVLAETHEGRPTKIEGNPSHPASLGATDVFAQASVLDLYDPERSRTTVHAGRAVRREQLLSLLDELRETVRVDGGRGLAILSEDSASLGVQVLWEHLSQVLPEATFHVYEPVGATPVSPSQAVYDLSDVDVIVSLDCDLLGLEDRGVRNRRAFADRRRVRSADDRMNRLYVVEPNWTTTGMAADHRLRLGASRVGAYAMELARALGVEEADMGTMRGEFDERWVSAVADDLRGHRGRCLVIAGRRQPRAVHELAARMNEALGAPRGTGFQPVQHGLKAHATIGELAERIEAGEVRTLLIFGGNPAYDAPADLDFASLIQRVPVSLRLGMYFDETSEVCTWHINAAHYLESWDVASAFDGTLSPVQPMIAPLFGGMQATELLARIGGLEVHEPYDIARRAFARIFGADDFENNWRRFLHEGVRRGMGVPPVRVVQEDVNLPISEANQHGRDARATGALSAQNVELCFAVDNTVFDGRFANNGWMQECPDPATKLVWDNAAILSPATAGELGLRQGDIVEISVPRNSQLATRNSIEAPVFVLPGHADYSITLPLGYGRRRGGVLATGRGFDAYRLRTTDAMWFAVGAQVSRTGRTYPLATTQDHGSIAEHHQVYHRRGIVREGSLEQFQRDPQHMQHGWGMHSPPLRDIFRNPLDAYKADPSLHQWGMTIDMTACTGCSACVVACQAENNIPIVGKNEVIRGREMHWMRLDRYFGGDDGPEAEVFISNQPMLCQHCDAAPCEPVCPVNAAVQSPEGLNEQVYNRCVGTRYCANNCPWKVRKFNYFDYNKGTIRESGDNQFDGNIEPNPLRPGFAQLQNMQPPMHETLRMQKNPNVTVRMRGVMEKCTFCVQRIQEAKISNKVAAGQAGPPQKVADGQVMTACQQACPTQAIVFGDVSDPNSRVSQLLALPQSYVTLEHLNTRPRVWYLGRIRNVNPAMPTFEMFRTTGGGHARVSLPVVG